VTRSTVTPSTTNTSVNTSGLTNGIAVTGVISGNNLVYVGGDVPTGTIDQLTGNATTTYARTSGWSTPVQGPSSGLSTPAGVASDGANNVWTINSGASSMVEVGSAKQALSPSGGFQKSSTYLGSGKSIVIDQSGNVWIGLNGANSITEIVGAAVPVYQPYARALAAGAFQTIP
jgi:hypothetical protein